MVKKIYMLVKATATKMLTIPTGMVLDKLVPPNFKPFVLDCRSEVEKKAMTKNVNNTFKHDFDVWDEKPYTIKTELIPEKVISHPFFIDSDDKIAYFEFQNESEDPHILSVNLVIHESDVEPYKVEQTF